MTLECPNISLNVLGSHPFSIHLVAKVCLSAWKLYFSNSIEVRIFLYLLKKVLDSTNFSVPDIKNVFGVASTDNSFSVGIIKSGIGISLIDDADFGSSIITIVFFLGFSSGFLILTKVFFIFIFLLF